jgi:hypothetical protein
LQIIGAAPVETLALGMGWGWEGTVNTWAMGVMYSWGS